MVTSFGFSQILGPPNYLAKENPHAKITANDVAPIAEPTFSAECSINETCVIDYPRPIDNPLLRTSSTTLMTKAQLNVQPLPVIYVKSSTAPSSISNRYKCTIVDMSNESPGSARSHPTMFCAAVDKSAAIE